MTMTSDDLDLAIIARDALRAMDALIAAIGPAPATLPLRLSVLTQGGHHLGYLPLALHHLDGMLGTLREEMEDTLDRLGVELRSGDGLAADIAAAAAAARDRIARPGDGGSA